LNKIAFMFDQINEPYASGFFENPERSRFFRYARAQRRFWERCTMPEYDGDSLYPCGKKYADAYAVTPNYSYTFGCEWKILEQKDEELAKVMHAEAKLVSLETPHTVGGNGYTHSIPNYKRIIKEGFNSYVKRIEKVKDDDFREGLLEIIEGIHIYRNKAIDLLEQANAPQKLLDTLRKIPFEPAETIYEAVVAWNFIYYIDGCDDPGRLDADLIEYYNGEEITPLLRKFFLNVDANDGWSGALGPDYNALTTQCLRAANGLRRPSIELRVIENMPEEIWDTAADALATGCGQPALYNEEGYQSALAERFPDIPKEDLLRFNGGGCTETMLAGISNVGSLDAGINAALIFAEFMYNQLEYSEDFEGFYQNLIDHIHQETETVLHHVNEYRKKRAQFRPQPVRTLLIDDCIDCVLDFNAGGARYNWSIINVAGMINIIDSLLAIRTLVFEQKEYAQKEFLDLLVRQEPAFLLKLRSCPCFGVDDECADSLAADFMRRVFDGFRKMKPYLGEAFLPSSIQFITYEDAGKMVGATPDGRGGGEPLCDSIGAVHGKDIKGVTALLNSVAKLPQREALGTPVLNLRLQKKQLKQYLRPLILGYFKQGGMQVQISCISREDMLDALEHPENHENLIVRIGGYSEYFNRLSEELKRMVIKRTEHGV